MNSKDGHSFLVIVSYDLNNIENAYCFFGNLFLLRTFIDSVKVMIKLPFGRFSSRSVANDSRSFFARCVNQLYFNV